MNLLAPIIELDDLLPSQNSDIAICTIPANTIAQKQLEITKPNIIKYASMCGADYVELDGDKSPEWPMSNKYRLKQVAEKYEYTLYLDCDIVVKENAPNVFNIFNKNKISFVDEWSILKSNYPDTLFKGMQNERRMILDHYPHLSDNNKDVQPNGGMLFFPKSMAHKYSQPNGPYLTKWCFDQDYLLLNLEDDDFDLVDWKFNLEFIDFDFWSKIEDAYFVHLNGSRPISYRIEVLKRIVNGIYDYLPQPEAKPEDGPVEAFRPTWRETCL